MSTTSIKQQGATLDAATPVNSTLVDELGLDFADSGSEDEQDENDAGPGGTDELDERRRHNGGAEGNPAHKQVDGDDDNLRRKKKPLNDARWQELEDILTQIADYEAKPASAHSFTSDTDPQYQLLTRANTFSTTIDDYTLDLLKSLRDIYALRFPELETLLPDPLEYAKTAAIIANGPMARDHLRDIAPSDDNPIRAPLATILSGPKLMTVTVEATSSKGVSLSEEQLVAVQSTVQKMLRLSAAKRIITAFVENRMSRFCPNLTLLITSTTAAELLTARSGLAGLAATRASNLPGVGSKRFAASGLASNTGVRNQGVLYNSPFVQQLAPELRVQAMRMIAAKVILAARIDLARSAPDGADGARFLDEINNRVDKLTEAPPNKAQRALPAPDDKPSKRRGGRRARLAKQATSMTEYRKAQNRMKFNEEEAETGYGTGDTTKGMGMIGSQDDGRIRALQIDNRTRAKLSKKNAQYNLGTTGGGSNQTPARTGTGTASTLRNAGPAGTASALRGHGLRAHGAATSAGAGTVGTASSLTFNPRQGLELVDPKVRAQMDKGAKAEEDKWFKGGSFTQLSGKEEGFKKPAVPMKRKAG